MMKVDVVWRRHSAVKLAACWVLLASCALWSGALAASPAGPSGPLGPSDRPEAYFNGSSYIRLSRPISLKQLVGLSFRTCVGGELFSQRYEGYTLRVSALFEEVVVQWAQPNQSHGKVGLAKETLNNRWHWVALRYRPNPPSLVLEVDKDSMVISNVTWNPELLSPGALESGGAVLVVGGVFSGCILEGPQLEFHATGSQIRNVEFGHCPLTTDDCIDRKDVLRIPPKDHCYNEPCMRHGTCISRHDRYECHCTARYTGNNCEVDKGDPCASAPCLNAGLCLEDARGDYSCECSAHYHGTFCELEVSLDPQCVAGPCLNNGSCSVPPGADSYVCACPPGYTGRNCETDIDECFGVAGACLNGGRCIDAVNNYTCDCSGTGYNGPRCEMNVNECEEDRNICGHGLCYDTYGSFVCACQPGYTGERCHSMSACASGPCGAGGACVEESGGAGFRCVCARGWQPPLCNVPVPAPTAPVPLATAPAPLCADVACPPRSHCIPNQMVVTGVITKQVSCVCDIGYYGAPGVSPNCTTWESACEVGVCLNGGTCTLATDHFNCTCAPGYKGAYCEQSLGKALSDLKAAERCANAPCLHAKACQDLASGYRCECEAGWTGPRCDVAAPVSPAINADSCAVRGCANGGVCRDGGDCECRAGWGGALCDVPGDCQAGGGACPPHHECVQADGAWHCAPAAPDSACASSPCHNGTCLALGGGLFTCQCPPGVNGRLCDTDIDECAIKPKICHHGVCFNVPGSYECYCRPGYTGDSCEQDIDECLSSPCKNGGTCQNLENNYECNCMEGFEGKDCSININECETNPCAAGSTCVDGIASYSCMCQDGLTGPNCETDIDDCQSQPCLHGGRCIDGLNSYTCECQGTGYSGPDCDVNIDECAPAPCHHAGTCVDDINDYHCACHPGYTGKNCESDIHECDSSPCKFGGVCLERSNASLYQPRDAAPLQVGPQPHMLLPDFFYQPFSYENAAGFECVCVTGTNGSRCETNFDECQASLCEYGKCVDGIGDYTCACFPGYEGKHCQHEIDECDRYRPCAHGKCIDGRASYYCMCAPGWGGQNCSVVLQGCRDQPCAHGGECHPWLQHETEHRFNCSCTPGHYGTTCEKITTMSLEKTSYAEVNTSREEGYDISFRFKTSLPDCLLAMGRGLTYFFLKLSNGRLNLHSSLLNKWEGVFIGSNLNDSNWQKVFVTINSSHLVLAANGEQTIYPISQNEAYNSSVTSFPSTRLGTAGSSYGLRQGPNFFIGCFQDVVVNGQWVLPEDSNATGTEMTTEMTVASGDDESGDTTGDGDDADGGSGAGERGDDTGMRARAALHGVLASCPRREQCTPNPCRSGGACLDAWSSYACTCPRPHLGDTCQYSYTAATFGQESAVQHSVVRVAVSEPARRAVRAALDISMFIRTRKPTGQIFYLGSLPRYGATDESQVGASLEGGELLVHLRFNQTPENYTVGGTRLDNGYLHLIDVVRNSTLVQVKLNGTEYFRKSISAAKQIDAQVLYLGGPPPPVVAPTTEAPMPSAAALSASSSASPAPSPAPTPDPAPLDVDDSLYFKGIIQDVQISNGVNVTIVEFFPLRVEGLALPPPFGEVTLDPAGVLRGVVSDDVCAGAPCQHNATCTNTWNDYVCQCPRGYKGKQCSEVEFCQLQGCPVNSYCRNLDAGYECVSNATFDGVNTTLTYKLRQPVVRGAALAPRPADDDRDLPDTLTITYRSKTGGTLFHSESGAGAAASWFTVGVFKEQVAVQYRLGSAPLPTLRRMKAQHSHLLWTSLRFSFAGDTLRGAFIEPNGHEEVTLTAPIDTRAWQTLVMESRIHLGGIGQSSVPLTTPAHATDSSTDPSVWEYSEGEEVIGDNLAGAYFKGCMGAVHVGGLLLPFFTEEQLFVGNTAALLAAQPHYALQAGRPYGAAASVGCLLCLESDCANGGHCADVRSSFSCSCPPGYAGDYCQTDVDECESHQCQNGATCQDGVASYTCICPVGYDGDFCEHDIDECASSPCEHGGTCVDGAGRFTCACAAAWRGDTCSSPRDRTCAHLPCASTAITCVDTPPDPPTGNNFTCKCHEGFEGVYCESAFCEITPCVHGRCLNDTKPATCLCEVGFSGRWCETERDECLEAGGAAACLHGGRCLDAKGDYLCDCDGTGWTGARCEVDVDECASGLVSCGPGDCLNLDGSYTCLCAAGYCGHECSLPDPCLAPAARPAANASGPCLHGATCEQRCAAATDYVCHCVDGWGGKNCSQQVVAEGKEGSGDGSSTVLIAVGAALVGLALAGAALGGLGAQARRKRATRGTYSPSGQEYCNPRAEKMQHALKPPPEERLI